MGDCDICDGDNNISYTCNECDGTFCSTHRLPESHNCQALRTRNFDEAWFKDELSVRDNHHRSENALDHDDSSDKNSEEVRESKNSTSSYDSNEDDGDREDGDRQNDNNEEDDHDDDNDDGDDGGEPTASGSCFECGKATELECEQCGGEYCRNHIPLDDHNCSLKSRGRSIGGRDVQETPPRPSMPGSNAEKSQSTLSSIVSVLLLPVGFLAAVVTGARRHWKVCLVVGLVTGGAGLAATGQLQPLVADAEDAVDTAGETGSDAADAADDAFSNELDTERVEELVHERMNEIRANRSLQTLDHDSELREIAGEYSERMATEEFYSHTDPQGNNFEDRYAAAGYQCRVPISDSRYATGSENIQYTYAFTDVRVGGDIEHYESEEELANAIVTSWMNSTGHRENILQSYWQNEGIGVYAIENPDGPGKKVYATQNFC